MDAPLSRKKLLIIIPVILLALVALFFVARALLDGGVSGQEAAVINSGAPNDEQVFGVNLGGVDYWSTDYPFVDIFKMNSGWCLTNDRYMGDGTDGWCGGRQYMPQLQTDENGYPLELPFRPPGATTGQVAQTIFLRAPVWPELGTYTVLYDGEGDINIDFNVTNVRKTPGKITFDAVSSSENGVRLIITRSTRGNHIRNIRVIMPGYLDTYEDEPFYPPYLDKLEGFKAIRYMDWAKTNSSQVERWSDRVRADSLTQAGPYGVSPEYMVMLANEIGADIWVTVPTRADDSYVRGLAQLFESELGSGQKVYIEYTNEIWNWIFPQVDYAIQKGCELDLQPENDNCTNPNLDRGYRWNAGLRYYTMRSLEIFRIFEQEFGGSDRLVRVLGTQVAWDHPTRQILGALDNSRTNPRNQEVDAVALAPYFGPANLPNGYDSTLDQILAAGENGIAQTDAWVKMTKAITEPRGLKLIAYEGGQHYASPNAPQHFTDKLIAANRDPRMKDLYFKSLDSWFGNGGGIFMHFNYIANPSKYGSWGLLESVKQPISTAYKYQALAEYFTRPKPAPTLELTVAPNPITEGASAGIAWRSSWATECTASGGWTGSKAVSGSEAVQPKADATYTLSCTGSGGTVEKSVALKVTTGAGLPPPTTSPPGGAPIGPLTPTTGTPIAPTGPAANSPATGNGPAITLAYAFATGGSVNSNAGAREQQVSLSWTAKGAVSCAASGAWSGKKRASGSESVAFKAGSTYTLTCYNTNGASTSATVTPVNNARPPLNRNLPSTL